MDSESLKIISNYIVNKFNIAHEKINNGYCYHWAYEFYKKFGGEIYNVTIDKYGAFPTGHVFVKLNGMFYDSDNINGVDKWKKLKWWKSLDSYNKCLFHKSCVTIYKNIEEFKDIWCLEDNLEVVEGQ